jgi:hypothetical protein
VNGEHQHPVTQDPYLYVDKRTDRVFTADIADIVPPCAQFGSSGDHGRTWTDSVACSLEDHQNIFTGPPPKGGSQPSGYPNVVYYCAIDAGAEAGVSKATSCLKSLDGGVTFVRTGDPAYVAPPDQLLPNPTRCDGGTGPGWVDAAGTVYLPRGLCGPPMLAISRDEGQTWTRVKVSSKQLGIQVLDGLTLYNHEAGVVGDRIGNLYYTWVAGADRLPYLTISHNGGRTWTKPMMIAPPGVKEAWNPAIDISPAGELVLAWMGSTNSPGPPFELGPHPRDYTNVTFNGYLTVIPAPLDANPTLYSTTVNDPADPFIKGKCEQIRCGREYDFIDAVAAPDGTAWADFVDVCTKTACIGGDLGEVVVARLPRP